MAVVGEGDDMKPLVKEMSDVGLFSYTALCAVSLRHLFNNQYDKKFCESYIKMLVKHTGQSKQVESSILSIMRGHGMDQMEPLAQTLVKDPALVKYGAFKIVEDLVVLGISQGCYDARMRVMIKDVSLIMRQGWEDMLVFEKTVVSKMQEEQHVMTERRDLPKPEEKQEKTSKERTRKIKRFALIGLATVGGGTLLGLTGGLAAPLLAGGLGMFIGTAGATALASTAGVAIIGSLFGVAGAGLAGAKMKRRVGALEEFEIEKLTEGSDLHVTLTISGWLTDDCPDFKTAWLGLDDSEEMYTLRYESEHLKQMGKGMDYLKGIVINTAALEGLKYTVLAGVLAAITWPMALISAASVIDNPWSVCAERAALAGKHMADVLLSRVQGKRPVTLVGFSVGARVIYYCLQEMAKRKNCEGIIEDVVMLGAPVPGDADSWQAMGRIVSGRIVNGYCRTDWLLKFLYRTTSVQISIAGLSPVTWSNRRMQNIDLSDMIEGHMDYMKKIDKLLEIVGLKTKERPEIEESYVQVAEEATENVQDQGDISKIEDKSNPKSDSKDTDLIGSEGTKSQQVPSLAQTAGKVLAAKAKASRKDMQITEVPCNKSNDTDKNMQITEVPCDRAQTAGKDMQITEVPCAREKIAGKDMQMTEVPCDRVQTDGKDMQITEVPCERAQTAGKNMQMNEAVFDRVKTNDNKDNQEPDTTVTANRTVSVSEVKLQDTFTAAEENANQQSVQQSYQSEYNGAIDSNGIDEKLTSISPVKDDLNGTDNNNKGTTKIVTNETSDPQDLIHEGKREKAGCVEESSLSDNNMPPSTVDIKEEQVFSGEGKNIQNNKTGAGIKTD